jgi:hypothetical protein
MSRGKSRAGRDEADAAAKLLRELAERAERDPDFGAQVAEAVRASGLLESATQPPAATAKRPKSAAPSAKEKQRRDTAPDPFPIYRDHGEAALRVQLAALDLATLRLIVRMHRLDPARISARWTASERVVSLIVDQVRARVNHGRAFERI